MSASDDTVWHKPFIEVSYTKDGVTDVTVGRIGNIFSHDIEELKQSILHDGLGEKTPNEIWETKNQVFPNLRFVPSVEQNLKALGLVQFQQAVRKLIQLQTSAENWLERPVYTIDVRPESEATMNKFGNLRKFRDGSGNIHVYELHSTVADGFRAHFREVTEQNVLEIGYIGPHLKVAKKN